MTYRDLLELYKAGKLDDKTKQEVEQAIEKQDAISEYLFDESDFPNLEEETQENEQGQEDDARLLSVIRKSIRAAFIKMGIIVGVCVLAVLLGIVFILPHAVSLIYYDPDEIVGRNEQNENLTTTRMSLDLAVYSEMFLPGRYRTEVDVQPEGYGEYVIRIPETWTIDGRRETTVGKLTRGELLLYNENILRLPTGNAFILPENVEGMVLIDGETGKPVGPGGNWKDQYQSLESLDDDTWYIGYVSFRELTAYGTFEQWFESQQFQQAGVWCAVALEDETGGYHAENMGFNYCGLRTQMYFDNEKYPYLSCMESENAEHFDPRDEAIVTEHFISMTKYLEDHPQVSKMFGGSEIRSEKGDLERLRENGMNLYGFAIIAKKDALMQLRDDAAVSYIYAEPWRQ